MEPAAESSRSSTDMNTTLVELNGDMVLTMQVDGSYEMKRNLTKQVEPTSWLMDPRLDDARVALTKTVMDLQQMGAWQEENEQLWQNLQKTSEAFPTMAKFCGLVDQRIEAAKATGNLDRAYVNKSREMELRLRHLQKIAGEVVDERMKKDAGCSGREPGPPAGGQPFRAGYTGSTLDLKDSGVSGNELRDAGTTAKELRDVGFTAADLRRAGYTTMDIFLAGYSPDELESSGYTVHTLKSGGVTARQLKAAGFSPQQVVEDAGYCARELKNAGYSAEQLFIAGYPSV